MVISMDMDYVVAPSGRRGSVEMVTDACRQPDMFFAQPSNKDEHRKMLQVSAVFSFFFPFFQYFNVNRDDKKPKLKMIL